MNEPATSESNDELIHAVDEINRPGLTAYRDAHADALARYGDAVTKIAEGRENSHRLRNELRRQDEATAWQERRKSALAKRIQAGKAFIRAIEDDEQDVEEVQL